MSEDVVLKIIKSLDSDIHQAFEAVVTDHVVEVRSRLAKSRILLLLSYPMRDGTDICFRILKHRSLELTAEHQGKLVRRKWIVDFSSANVAMIDGVEDITYSHIPADCEILKSNDVKVVVRDKFGSTVTCWKDGKPQVSLAEYDGTRTRNWERQVDGVTNWYYDSVRF